MINDLVGGNFRDLEGEPLANGYLTFELSHDEQESATPSQVVGGLINTISLDNTGNVAAGQGVEANDTMNPSGSYYIVRAFRSDGTRAWRAAQFVTIPSSPSPYNLSAIVPSNPPPQSAINAGGTSILLQTNGVNNLDQTKLNLFSSDGSVTLTADDTGDVDLQSSGGGGGLGALQALENGVPDQTGNSFYSVVSFSNAPWFCGHWEFVTGQSAYVTFCMRMPTTVSASAYIILEVFSSDTAGHTASLQTSDGVVAAGASMNVSSLTAAPSQTYTSSTTAYARKTLTFAIQSALTAGAEMLVVKVAASSIGTTGNLMVLPYFRLGT